MQRLVTASVLAMLIATLALTGCGDDDDADATATTAATAVTETSPTAPADTPGGSPTTGDDETAAVEESVDTVVVALVERDRDRLRDLTGAGAQQRLRDQDLDRLMECVPDGATIELVSRTVTIDGDTATVVVRLEVTDADGTVSTVERTWLFERDNDGSWKLAEIPDCPFES